MQRMNHVIPANTKQRLGMLFFTLLLVSLWCSLPQAFAAKGFKVGFVDPQAVIENTKAGKRALETLKEHAEIRQKLLAADQQELKSLQEELQNSEGLSNKETQTKQGKFQRKVQEYQKRANDFQVELGNKQQAKFKELLLKIQAAVKAVANRHGFSLVIDKGNDATLKIVLYSRKGLDITSEVVKEFNKKFP
jgi:outer membrane protein